MITAKYIGNCSLKKVCAGNEKQISAMLSKLPSGTTVTIKKRPDRESRESWIDRMYSGCLSFDDNGTEKYLYTKAWYDRNGSHNNLYYDQNRFTAVYSNWYSRDIYNAMAQKYHSEALMVEGENDHYHIVSPDGYSAYFSCDEWTIICRGESTAHEAAKAERKKPTASPVVVPSVDPAPVVPDYIRDHLEIVVISDKPKKSIVPDTGTVDTIETVSVPVIPVAIYEPIPTRKERIIAAAQKIGPDITIIESKMLVWVGGNTYPHRQELKANGFRWSPNKKMWWADCTEKQEV
jgi:hypothetical protein